MGATRLLPPIREGSTPGSTLWFAVTATAVGALTGVVTGTFKAGIDLLSRQRTSLIAQAHGSPVLGCLAVVVVCAGCTALAAFLVRRVEPHASGSGIPRVEAVVQGRIRPGSARILPVKYVGGLLAIGAGLALGREGPSVQMGGNIAIVASRLTRRNIHDVRILVAAGAAAGLATAFNAPIAGGVFVLEELLKRFDPRATVATLLASAAGFASSRLLLGGSGPMLAAAPMAEMSVGDIPLVLLLGVLTGVAGAGYNHLLLAAGRTVERLTLPVEARAAIIGGCVGAVGFFGPRLVGGGDNLTEAALQGRGTILVVAGVLLVRVVLAVVSYSAGTPGGIFAPMLVIGTHLGLLFGLVAQAVAPSSAPEPAALALIAMAAFFTASVRAPVTGCVLAAELTGVSRLLPPMLGACAVAMLLAQMLRSSPIYEALSLTARSE